MLHAAQDEVDADAAGDDGDGDAAEAKEQCRQPGQPLGELPLVGREQAQRQHSGQEEDEDAQQQAALAVIQPRLRGLPGLGRRFGHLFAPRAALGLARGAGPARLGCLAVAFTACHSSNVPERVVYHRWK